MTIAQQLITTGEKRGEKRGEKHGIEIATAVLELIRQGKSNEEIIQATGLSTSQINKLRRSIN